MRKLAVAAFAFAAPSSAFAQIGAPFSDSVPGRAYHLCQQGSFGDQLRFSQAFDPSGKPLGYSVTASMGHLGIVRFNGEREPSVRTSVTLAWPKQSVRKRRIDPVFDNANASVSIFETTRNDDLRNWKKGVLTQYIVDRGDSVYFWRNGATTNIGLSSSSPALMTEPNRHGSSTVVIALADLLAWSSGLDYVDIHKIAVAKANKREGAIAPFGERRLLYTMQIDVRRLEIEAAHVATAFQEWSRGVAYKDCPVLVEEDESQIIVTEGPATQR